MENRSHALAVGVFVLLFITGIIAAFKWLGGNKIPQTPYYVLTDRAVSGLVEGSDVRVQGLRVGKIVNFRFNPEKRQEVLIKVLINSDIPVTTETYARIAYQGITGQGAIELNHLDGGTPLNSSEDDLAVIPMKPSVLESLTTYVGKVLKKANSTLRQIDKLLDDQNIQALSATMQSAQKTAAQLPAFVKSLEQTNRNLQKTLANVDQLVGSDARLAIQDIQKAATGVYGLSEEGKLLFERLDGELSSLSGNMETTILPKVNSTLDELSQTSESLKYLMNQINQNPAGLLRGIERQPGPGEAGFNQGE